MSTPVSALPSWLQSEKREKRMKKGKDQTTEQALRFIENVDYYQLIKAGEPLEKLESLYTTWPFKWGKLEEIMPDIKRCRREVHEFQKKIKAERKKRNRELNARIKEVLFGALKKHLPVNGVTSVVYGYLH